MHMHIVVLIAQTQQYVQHQTQVGDQEVVKHMARQHGFTLVVALARQWAESWSLRCQSSRLHSLLSVESDFTS